jgi:hypothetical protein
MTPEAKEFLQLAKQLKELGATELVFGDYSVVFGSQAEASPTVRPQPVLVALPPPAQTLPPPPPPPEPQTPKEVRAAISKVLLDDD